MNTTYHSSESAAPPEPADYTLAEIILARHPKVQEAVVVGRTDAQRGHTWVAFVIPKHGIDPSPQLRDELWHYLINQAGPATPVSELRFAETLPKTRSGKILRRALHEMASGAANHPV